MGRITLDGSIKILCPFLGDLISSATNDSPIIMPDFSSKTFKTFYSVLTKGYAEDCQNFENVVDIARALNISMEGLIVEKVGGGRNENSNEEREYYEAVNENDNVDGIENSLSKVKNENRFIKCEEKNVLSERQVDSSDSSQNQKGMRENIKSREIFQESSKCMNATNINIRKPHLISSLKKVSLSSPAPMPLVVPRTLALSQKLNKNTQQFSFQEHRYLRNRHQHLNKNIHSSGKLSHVIKANDAGYYENVNESANKGNIQAAEVSKDLCEVSDVLNKIDESREFKVIPKERAALNSHKAKHNKKDTDVSILDYRKKQVDSFKRSDLYKAYTVSIPRKNRIGNAPPSISKYRTKRQWVQAMNCWKDRVRRKVEGIEKEDENYYQNGKQKPK